MERDLCSSYPKIWSPFDIFFTASNLLRLTPRVVMQIVLHGTSLKIKVHGDGREQSSRFLSGESKIFL